MTDETIYTLPQYFPRIGIDLRQCLLIGEVTEKMFRPEIKEAVDNSGYFSHITEYHALDYMLRSIKAFPLYFVITPCMETYVIGKLQSQKINNVVDICGKLFLDVENYDGIRPILDTFFNTSKASRLFHHINPFSDDVSDFITTCISRNQNVFFRLDLPILTLRVNVRYHQYILRNAMLMMDNNKTIGIQADTMTQLVDTSKNTDLGFTAINDAFDMKSDLMYEIGGRLDYRSYSSVGEVLKDPNIEMLPCSDPVIHGSKQEELYKKIMELYWGGET